MESNKNSISNLFENIENFEKKFQEKIRDKTDLFYKIMTDNDIFNKLVTTNQNKSKQKEEEQSDIIVDGNIKLFIEEINQSVLITNLIQSNIKIRNEIKEEKIIRRPKYYSYCRENGSNLAVSPFTSFFDQNYIRNKLKPPQFYSKFSELELISSIFKTIFFNQIKRKFEFAFEDSENNDKTFLNNNNNNLINKLIGTENEKNNSKIYSKSQIKNIINNSIERLFPKPKIKEKFDDNFFINIINEARAKGELNKKLNIEQQCEKMKINKKKDLNVDLKFSCDVENEIINNYYLQKSLFQKNKNNNNNNKKEKIFKRGELEFSEKNLLNTQSKLYIRVDRKNQSDLKLLGKQINNPIQINF
jgi:hypothetical protein